MGNGLSDGWALNYVVGCTMGCRFCYVDEIHKKWSYQRVGDIVFEAWVSRGKRGVIIAPTGTGKTVIAIHAIRALDTETLVIVPTERILKTWLTAFRRFGLTATPYYGRVKNLSRLTVSIYNSVAMHPEILAYFKMVVLDEVHHVASKVFSQILPRLDEKAVMSLTATPKREDGLHHSITSKFPIAYVLDLKTAVESGYVSPIDVMPVPAPLSSFERMSYIGIERRIRQLQQTLASNRQLGRNVKELEQRLRLLQRRGYNTSMRGRLNRIIL